MENIEIIEKLIKVIFPIKKKLIWDLMLEKIEGYKNTGNLNLIDLEMQNAIEGALITGAKDALILKETNQNA